MKKVLFTLLFIFLALPAFFAYAQTPVPIKILLVPGHDDEVWGAQYGNMKEADMNLRLATELFNILKGDKRFKVHILRDSKGYTKEFADYFAAHQADIIAFKDNAKQAFQAKISSGSIVSKIAVYHNGVSQEVAIDLYGTNKWANENNMDAVIHVHFNDVPRSNKWTMGQYKGFTVYMPESQLTNSKESDKLAQSIFSKLKQKYLASNYPPENEGLVADQKLIALGASDTLLPSVRAVLIEYGYIYRFGNTDRRHKFYTSMANLTATGIKNYFFPTN